VTPRPFVMKMYARLAHRHRGQHGSGSGSSCHGLTTHGSYHHGLYSSDHHHGVSPNRRRGLSTDWVLGPVTSGPYGMSTGTIFVSCCLMIASASSGVLGLVTPAGLSGVCASTTSMAPVFMSASDCAGVVWTGAPEQATTRPMIVHVMVVVLEQRLPIWQRSVV